MFSLFEQKPNYSALFSSPESTYKFIYGDRTKTAEILGADDFIGAWLSSPQMPHITALIRQEALKGDVPSIKQMIWLSDTYYQNATQIGDTGQRLAIQKSALTERIMFCEKAIGLGMKDRSYQAMISCANLYSLLESSGSLITDQSTTTALNGIVRNAKLFLESGYDDPQLITDTKELLKHFEPLAKIKNALTQAQTS